MPAATSPGQLGGNGMSPSNRGSRWANSGMVVEIHPEDIDAKYAEEGALCMMAFQDDLERLCRAKTICRLTTHLICTRHPSLSIG